MATKHCHRFVILKSKLIGTRVFMTEPYRKVDKPEWSDFEEEREGILPRERIVEEYENDEELKAYKKSCFEWKVGKSKGEQISDTRRSGKNENSRIRLHMTKGLRIPVLEQQMGHMGVDKSFNLMN